MSFKRSFSTRSWLIFLAPLLCVSSLGYRPQEAPPAIAFPQHLVVEVTGAPALASTIKDAVYGSLQSRLPVGATAEIEASNVPVSALGKGQHFSYSIPVVVSETGKSLARGSVTVDVQNIPEALGTESQLWFCNKPENLKHDGPLFASDLALNQSVRLLYHHVNHGTQPMFMIVELINDSDVAAEVAIIPGDSKPNRNPVLSGTEAAVRYLPARSLGSGDVITLPPHKSVPIAFRRVVMGQVMSGLASLQLIKGPAKVHVRAQAIYPFDTNRQETLAMLSPKPYLVVAPRDIPPAVDGDETIAPLKYINPQESDTLSVTAGSKSDSVKVGVEGIPRLGGGRSLNGNYGVLYSLSAQLSNPNDKSVVIDWDLAATTNYTAGVFTFPGKVVVVTPIQKQAKRTFYRTELKPFEKRTVKVQTMPISGGAYPATVTLNAGSEFSGAQAMENSVVRNRTIRVR